MSLLTIDSADMLATIRESLVHQLAVKLGVSMSPAMARDIAANLTQAVMGLERGDVVIDEPAPAGDSTWRPTDGHA